MEKLFWSLSFVFFTSVEIHTKQLIRLFAYAYMIRDAKLLGPFTFFKSRGNFLFALWSSGNSCKLKIQIQYALFGEIETFDNMVKIASKSSVIV